MHLPQLKQTIFQTAFLAYMGPDPNPTEGSGKAPIAFSGLWIQFKKMLSEPIGKKRRGGESYVRQEDFKNTFL